MRLGLSKFVLRIVLLFVLLCMSQSAFAGVKFRRYESDHYKVATTLSESVAKIISDHMDLVYKEYQRRFSEEFKLRKKGKMNLYLFQTQKQYEQFLSHYGLNGRNSGGMFFVTHRVRGLATFVGKRSMTQTLRVLQHEGFHQFAVDHISSKMPVWLNEGLAEYFEDGLLTDKGLRVGFANARRLSSIKAAMKRGKMVPLDKLLKMSGKQWRETLIGDPDQSELLYDQAWSFVYFLSQEKQGKYQKSLVNYMKKVRAGHSSFDELQKSLGVTDFKAFEKNWRLFLLKLRPDSLTNAIQRMEFLAHGMRYMSERGKDFPKNTMQLRTTLRNMGFATAVMQHGVKSSISSLDNMVYYYKTRTGVMKRFRCLTPTMRGLPPRLTAPGLEPEPTLVWSVTRSGHLISKIEYR